MKICLIGGIYGAPRGYLQVTPETTLEAGLREAGHQVTTLSHYATADFGSFDVVHVHHLSWGALRLASDPSPVPFVFTLHDASRMNGVRTGPVRSAALRFVLSRTDCLIPLSQTEAAFHQKADGMEPERMAAIPNGIDATQFPFAPRETAQGRPWRLLYAGQLIPLKGCDLLLRAFAQLRQDATLKVVYHAGPCEAELKALAASLGVAHRVEFAGRQDRGRLAALYRESDLLVLASETESLPSVITEAMFSGLPFVATAVGGVPEQASGFGHLVQRRTPEHLAGAIDAVLAGYERYSRAALDMSESARSRFSIPAMVKRHLVAYGQIAGQRPRRAAWRAAVLNSAVRARLAARMPAAPPAAASEGV